MDTIKIRKPDDFHLHLRRGEVLRKVLSHTVGQFARALIMPNTKPGPILAARHVSYYLTEIISALDGFVISDIVRNGQFKPLMTIQITEATTPEMIFDAVKEGATAGKIYPQDVTTNSENGVVDYRLCYPAFGAMQGLDMVLSLHGELPGEMSAGIDKEVRFLHTLRMIAKDFPELRIVLEHITTKEAVRCIAEELPGTVAATITVHHLFLTLDDVIGYSKESKGKMQPHNFCKPVAKSRHDRAALREAVTSGNPKFFFGSDSAPHLKGTKECASVCAGCFTAPVALPLLCQMFDYLGHLDRLEAFVSEFGAGFYKLPLNEGSICLARKQWTVPEECDGIVPFMAGQNIFWQIEA